MRSETLDIAGGGISRFLVEASVWFYGNLGFDGRWVMPPEQLFMHYHFRDFGKTCCGSTDQKKCRP